ncbi:MAG: hypothetical protein Q4C98_09280 [Capnocytophaga sp.]|nr:hypothetical protein [Capnocytophaga sp.]
MQNISDLQKIALRQNAIFIPKNLGESTKIKPQTLHFVRLLEKHGFAVSETLLHALNQTTNEDKKQIENYIAKILGTKLNWTPLVKNWEIPTGESRFDHEITAWFNGEISFPTSQEAWNYYYDKVYDFDLELGTELPCGHFIPEGTFPLHRYNGCPFCGTPFVFGELSLENQGSKKRMLSLWTEKDLAEYTKSLLLSKLPLDATQSDSLKILLQNIDLEEYILSEELPQIPMKETLMLVVDELISLGKERQAGQFFRSATDILRYLWYKKTGFLQIIEPKTIIKREGKNHQHIAKLWDMSVFAKILTKEGLKLKYSRKEAKMVANWLNILPLSAEKIAEQMHPKRGMWVRFIRALRLVEYSKKTGFERLKAILETFHSGMYDVWQGRVNHFKLKSDAEKTFALLRERPGLFARSLFANMLWFGAEITLAEFQKVASQLPMRLLLTLTSYAELYFRRENKRSVRTITGLRKEIVENQYTKLYSEEELTEMQKQVRELCLKAFQERFSKEETDFQRVYIDPKLKEIPFPIGDRSQNVQDFEPTFMGEAIPLEGNKIRLFMQWGEGLPAQHLDMDLSCDIIYTDSVDSCSFSRLQTKGCKHSGDIREIPNKVGTAEYIEVQVDELQKAKAQFVVFACNAYSVGGITPNLVVGWMDSKHKMKVSERTGVAYDPSCVARQIRISQSLQKGLVFGVLDIQNQHIIWVEMPFSGQTIGQLDYESILTFLQKLKSKISIGKILTIKAKAQYWEIVKDPNLADVIYDIAWAKNHENLNSLLVEA